jgi:hypothetical protein
MSCDRLSLAGIGACLLLAVLFVAAALGSLLGTLWDALRGRT